MSLRLGGADESAHEPAVNFGRDRIHVDALIAQEGPRIADTVDASGLNGDVFKADGVEFETVVLLFQRACNTADPKQNTLTNLLEHRTSRDDVGNGEPAAGLENTEGFAQHAILVG